LDGGYGSVVDFFVGRARSALLAQWQTETPAKPQAFGYDASTDKALHEQMLESRDSMFGRPKAPMRVRGAVRSPVLRDATVGLATSSGMATQLPALLTWNLRAGFEKPSIATSANPKQFTGFGESQTQAEEFELRLTGLAAEAWCVALIISRDFVELLFEQLAPEQKTLPAPGDVQSAAAILHAALEPDRFQPKEDDAGRAALLWSSLWSTAPGLEGRTTAAGEFSCDIRLPIPAPTLEFGSCVAVLCA
jgi:hypothetical protein